MQKTDKTGRFSLFSEEEAVFARAEEIVLGLGDMADDVRNLAHAYRKSWHEQQRLVRLSDRMQQDLQQANRALAEQTRELIVVNEMLSEEVEHRKRLEIELRRMAETDVLTGALSRRWFLDVAEREIQRQHNSDMPVTFAVIDLDHFKQINDTCGHAGGDAALRAFVTRCRDILREQDIIGRIGGEEFAIMLPQTDIEGGFQASERIRRHVAETNLIFEGRSVPLSASFGVAQSRPGESIQGVFKRADDALYAAKAQGRNSTVRAAA